MGEFAGVLDTVLKLSQVGSVTLLLISVWAFARGAIVPRWVHDEALKREAAVWTLYEREKATVEKLLDTIAQAKPAL